MLGLRATIHTSTCEQQAIQFQRDAQLLDSSRQFPIYPFQDFKLFPTRHPFVNLRLLFKGFDELNLPCAHAFALIIKRTIKLFTPRAHTGSIHCLRFTSHASTSIIATWKSK